MTHRLRNIRLCKLMSDRDFWSMKIKQHTANILWKSCQLLGAKHHYGTPCLWLIGTTFVTDSPSSHLSTAKNLIISEQVLLKWNNRQHCFIRQTEKIPKLCRSTNQHRQTDLYLFWLGLISLDCMLCNTAHFCMNQDIASTVKLLLALWVLLGEGNRQDWLI